MRILIATTHRNLVGGVERYLKVVIPGLLKQGHDVALLHERPADLQSELIEATGVRIPIWCAAASSSADTRAAVARWGPEVVYSQGLEDGELEEFLLQAYPAVLYAHNYFGTCISGRKCHSFPVIQPCSRRFGPACLLHYFPHRCGGLHPFTMWKMFKTQSQVHSRLRAYRAMLVASNHMREEFRANEVPAEHLFMAPLPIESAPPASTFVGKTPQGRILFAGRLTDIKGAAHLVKAVALAANGLGRALTLTIAGHGPELAHVRGLTRNLGVTLNHNGWVRSEQKSELMRNADLLAVPSLWPEPFGLVGIEAGCWGVPAAGYAVGGIPDWLIPGVTGELAPGDPPTAEGLALAIVRALRDANHYEKLCRGAFEAAQRFTLDAHLAILEPILASCSKALPKTCLTGVST